MDALCQSNKNPAWRWGNCQVCGGQIGDQNVWGMPWPYGKQGSSGIHEITSTNGHGPKERPIRWHASAFMRGEDNADTYGEDNREGKTT